MIGIEGQVDESESAIRIGLCLAHVAADGVLDLHRGSGYRRTGGIDDRSLNRAGKPLAASVSRSKQKHRQLRMKTLRLCNFLKVVNVAWALLEGLREARRLCGYARGKWIGE